MKKSILPLFVLSALMLCGCSSSNVSLDENNYDNDPISGINDDGVANDYDSDYTKDSDVEIPSSFDSFSDNTISAAGHYYLKGEYPSISITASKNSEVYVYLDGVSISSSSGIAFGSSNAIKLYVVLLNNSVNIVENDFLDTNAFHVKGYVHIQGSGSLNITSKQKSALKVSKDLFINDITLNVNGAAHGITAQSVTIDGAIISSTAIKDGIQAESSDNTTYNDAEGFVKLVNTKYTANTNGDGIQADTYVYVSGGEQNIKTIGEFVSYSTSNMETYGLSTDDFKFVKSGSVYKRVAKDEIHYLSSSYYALANSVKGIKAGALEYDSDSDGVEDTVVTTNADYRIGIAHGAKLTVDSYDDCVHTNYGKVDLLRANLTLSTIDDGVHADYNLNINNASIVINSSYEGLEGANVTIDGSETNIVSNSDDDGINAASDLVSQTNITINDGYLRVYASGDGLDANTSLIFNGGKTIVEGPGSGNGSLDSDLIKFNGGVVFACSTSGMTEQMSATQATFVYQGSTFSSGALIAITLGSDTENPLFSYTLKQSCNQIIFSHPSLKQGSTYSIYNGSSSSASITMSSTLTKVGSSQGGPGGGGGHGPH